MKELSVFIDESGDFGPFRGHAPYYLLTLVFHNQESSIEREVSHLKQALRDNGFADNHAIHAGPLIRREKDYANLPMASRRKLFAKQFTFTRFCDITYKTLVFKKQKFSDHDDMVSKMSRSLGNFVRSNDDLFQKFDRIIVYYDNGQKEITKMVNTVFNALLINIEARKVTPADYCLFQAADMICTLELLSAKLDSVGLTRSEEDFFISKSGSAQRNLRKNYLKPLAKKQLESK